MAPHGCYRCKGDDKWVSIAVATDEEWRSLCRVAGHPEWAEDPRFADRYGRWRHQKDLDALLAGWTRRRRAETLTRRLQRAGVAAMPSMDVADILNDPHSQARGIFYDVEHPKLGMTHPVRPPWLLSETPAEARRFGPMFGEHVEYVFGEIIGLPKAEMDALAAERVFE